MPSDDSRLQQRVGVVDVAGGRRAGEAEGGGVAVVVGCRLADLSRALAEGHHVERREPHTNLQAGHFGADALDDLAEEARPTLE